MCPILPIYRYERIACNEALPQYLRDAALKRIALNKSLQACLGCAELKAQPKAEPPATNLDNFHCRIYSMGNEWPKKEDGFADDDFDKYGDVPLPGTILRSSDPNDSASTTTDTYGNICYKGFQSTYEFYSKLFGRNSFDDGGTDMVASIHVGDHWDNAMWLPLKNQMVFGDAGDPSVAIISTPYCTYDIETIGHELTHAVVQSTAGFNDPTPFEGAFPQADTLNESIADIFGHMLKHWVLNITVEESDWDISPGWYTEKAVAEQNWKKDYLRTFRNPDKSAKESSPEPKHWDDQVGSTDSHINVGIPNHAFYLVAKEFGGYVWKTAGQIWYAALVDPDMTTDKTNHTFRGFATTTIKQASKLFGSKAEAFTKLAWVKVGVFAASELFPNESKLSKRITLSADEISRYKSTSTGQYHSVVVISEEMINEQLKSYYNAVPEMRKMSVTNFNMGTGIDAELLPPRVQIPANGNNLDRSKVIYHLRIKKGKIFYSDIPMRLFNPQKHQLKEVEVKDWDFAFYVNLDMQNVQEDQEEVKKLLRVAGEYSIQRLMLNFGMSNTSQFIDKLSDLRMPDGTKPKPSLIASLGGWIKEWTVGYKHVEERLRGVESYIDDEGQLQEGDPGCPLLYHALAPDPSKVNPSAPSIPPTAVIVQTYQFQRPDGKTIGDTNRNSIAYTETCDLPPRLPEDIIFNPSNGNFVTDDKPWVISDDLKLSDSNVIGSMCLSSEILFGRHFVPKLNPIVKMTMAHLLHCETKDNSFSWDLTFGGNPDHPNPEDPYYSMTRMPGYDEMYTKKTWFGKDGDSPGDVENAWGYRWVMPKSVFLKSEDNHIIRDTSMKLEVRSSCNLLPLEGQNRVRFSGRTTIALYGGEDTMFYKPEGKGFATSGNWRMDFVLKTKSEDGSLNDGHLDIEVEYDKDFVKFTDWTDGHGVDGLDWSGTQQKMKDKLTENLNGLKDYIEKTVKDSLKQSQFVLAGCGYFTMHNPIFTTKGDLLVEIKYQKVPVDADPKDYQRNQLSETKTTPPVIPAMARAPLEPLLMGPEVPVKGLNSVILGWARIF